MTTGLKITAGFGGGIAGGGSGTLRPITMSSMFKMSESIMFQLPLQHEETKGGLNHSHSNIPVR